MEERQGELDDLYDDILKEILIRVARSPNGAKDFVMAISISKAFRRFVEDVDVLRAVTFDDLLINDRWELFQLKEGLICRCALAGQEQAQFILAKIILVSTSQMLGAKMHQDEEAFSTAAEASNDNLHNQNTQVSSFLESVGAEMDHSNFVKVFLSRASASELLQMKRHLDDYMNLFIRCSQYGQCALHMPFGLLYGVEVKLKSAVATFANQLTEMRLRVCAWMWMQMLEHKIEEVGPMEDREICGYGAETFDMLLKRLWAMEAVVGEASRTTTQLSMRENAGCDLSFSQAFSREAMKLKTRIKRWKSIASVMEDSRASLVSDFESLALRQLATGHIHSFRALISNLRRM